MKKKVTITIPEPCHENWSKMTPTEKGRHCAVCTKEVVDFTHKTDEQIVKSVMQGSTMCGRFKTTQINRSMQLERKTGNALAPYAATLLLPAVLLSSSPSQAQEKSIHPTVQTTSAETLHGSLKTGKVKIRTEKSRVSFMVSGTILDDTGLPLSGAIIAIKDTTKGTQSDFDGNFKLNVSIGDTLLISYVGFTTTTKSIVDTTTGFTIQLESDFILGETIIIAGMIRTDYDPDPNQTAKAIWPIPEKQYETGEQSERRLKRKERIAKTNAYRKFKWAQEKAARLLAKKK